MAQQTKKPDKSKNNGAGDTPVGSSWPDVGRDLVKSLGLATPWVVMLAGLGYGFLEYQKLSVKNEEILQKAQAEANRLYGDNLEASNKALIANYAEIQNSTKRQIKNVDDILDVTADLMSQFKLLNAETIEAHKSQRKLERESNEIRRTLETDVAKLEDRLKVVKAALQTADAILYPKIAIESVTERAFQDRKDLKQAIDGLDAAKAKALIIDIQTVFPSVTPFVALQYPDDVRDADADGSKAKAVLKRLVSRTAKEREDRSKWLDAIGAREIRVRAALADDITQALIEQLIDDEQSEGATSCEVVTENNQRFLVCQWPPLF